MNQPNKLLDELLEIGSDLSDFREKLAILGNSNFFRYGLNKDFSNLVKQHYTLGKALQNADLLLSINAHLWGGIHTIKNFGSEEQVNTYLEPMLKGHIVSGHAITERESGSDIANMSSSGIYEADHIIFSAEKRYITNAPIADVVIVYVNLDKNISPIIVHKDDPGVTFNASHTTYGFAKTPIGEVIINNSKLPKTRLLGYPEKKILGTNVIQFALELERAFIFSGLLGIMDAQLSEIIKFTKSRRIKDNKLFDLSTVNHKLAEISLRNNIIRLLIEDCAKKIDAGKRITLESSYAKWFSAEAFLETSTDIVQIMGALGLDQKNSTYINNVHNALASRILSGTTEIQKNIVGNLLDVVF